MPTKVDVYLDYVCPFCFLIEDAIAELKHARDVDIELKPFELRPDPVPTLRPEDGYLPRVWKQSVYPMAERLGFDITLPTISPQPRTEKALLVFQLARQKGVPEEYSEAMFKAFFQQHRNIGDDEVIIDVAASVGLEREDVERALASEEFRAKHRAELEHAVKDLAIEAVPSIFVDGELVCGVPSATRLKKVVDQAVQRQRQEVADESIHP
ncbi:DsbA family oxidoreductase [Sediminivirga luteola]|uniref:DsbA family oxidoreductase n=1 Tax=Sediminivirga luteola TaxID=1774748 RepID=UPI001F594591|nr:DsbA family protein [Sediminivirga luteola]MCI2266022.1 DsbA family protein [Sediminivirga luteola]